MANNKMKIGKVPNSKRNIPNVRFPGFVDNWEVKKIKDLGVFIGGGTPDTTIQKFWEGETPWISSSDVTINDIHNIQKTRFITEDAIKSSATKLIPKGAILMVSRVGIGKFAIADEELCTSQDFTNLISTENEHFLCYYFSARSSYFVRLSQGTSIKGFTIQDIKAAKFLIPSINEQEKIASFLSLIDERIQTQNKIIEQFETLIKGLSEKLFSQKIRFNEFTDEWELKSLGEVLIKNSTKNKSQKHKIVQSVSNKYGFINQEEMFEERRVASTNTSNYYVIKKGDFAYNPSRINVGSLAYKNDDEISIISPLYISFKANNIFLIDDFLWYWFKIVEFIRQMNNSFEGSVRNTLSYENLTNMNISIPSIKEQTAIAQFLSSIDQKLQTEKDVLEQLEKQKKFLLQNLFV